MLMIGGLMALTVLPVRAAERLNNYDRQIVASCMVLEAASDGSEGMQAVLNVILNRADGYLYRMIPETVRRGAFSCMSPVWKTRSPDYGRLIGRAQNQPASFAEAMRLIDQMECGQLWDNTHGATHYHAVSIDPYWADGMHYITTIGHHRFYTDRADQMASL
jgi:spore germination cell wall hydrolase CwlJ-like protein